MTLTCRLFHSDQALQSCAVSDAAHVTPGAKGAHVGRIQTALLTLDGFQVPVHELRAQHYGPATAQGVLAYKTRRQIINHSYQRQADNIVGRMTIAAMDGELRLRELLAAVVLDTGNEPAAT